MKADISRVTFAKAKHYASVVLQQGRVAVDADWNEQQALERYVDEETTTDVVGPCGTPLDAPQYVEATGFRITVPAADPTTIAIGAGQTYVDGILAENERDALYADQGKPPLELPDPPAVIDVLGRATVGLVYLDVWRRHVTHLDDGRIKESALGEADTATRLKTTWQVKVLPLSSVAIAEPEKLAELLETEQQLAAAAEKEKDENKLPAIRAKTAAVRAEIEKALGGIGCSQAFPEWAGLVAAPTGTLKARSVRPTTSPTPCEPPPSAGYTRLENQLYRVEVHRGGPLPGRRTPPTFKWSRENAWIQSAIESFDGNDWITLHDLGRDAELGFHNGQWVELVNDRTELDPDGTRTGLLAKIVDMNPARRQVQLSRTPAQTDPLRRFALNPRLRRWDQFKVQGPPAVTPGDDGIAITTAELPLEDGVQIQFSNGTYRAGDHWLIPARTATGDVEWPPNPDDGAGPFRAPFGVTHHFCRLALVMRVAKPKPQLVLLADCRKPFAPLTEGLNAFVVGGDGQEVKPPVGALPARVVLPEPLVVGVTRGTAPVAGARIRFSILGGGNGQLQGGGQVVEVLTGSDGVARCDWSLDADPARPEQNVEARLLAASGAPTHLPMRFTANLSIAREVAYDPGNCAHLANDTNVQAALDRLARIARLSILSGNDQIVPLAQRAQLRPLEVLVGSDCGPVQGAEVTFTVRQGTGKVDGQGSAKITTDSHGVARCDWRLDGTTTEQRVVAILTGLPPGGSPATIDPNGVGADFVAHLSVSSGVTHVPKCAVLKKAKVTTVDQALEVLCAQKGGTEDEPGIRITEVLGPDRKTLVNDSEIPVNRFFVKREMPLITVVFSEDVDPRSLLGKKSVDRLERSDRHPNLYLTVDLPFPLTRLDRAFWTNPVGLALPHILGYYPLTLPGFVTVDGPRASWEPTEEVFKWLSGPAFQQLKGDPGEEPQETTSDRLLVRLTLKGNFIWGRELFVDGEPLGPRSVFGNVGPYGDESGNARRGGDFELWFWLRPRPKRQDNRTDEPVPRPREDG